MANRFSDHFTGLKINSYFGIEPARKDPQMVGELKAHNSKQMVNQLPIEVLANIFAIGADWERGSWDTQGYRVSFWRLSTQVCTHWYQVAINTPTLWTYISISNVSYTRLVPLHLLRAGPSSPLDIQLHAHSDTYSPVYTSSRRKDDTQFILDALHYLISTDAAPNRWRSLLVSSEDDEALPALVQFLNNNVAPNLQFISFKFSGSAWRAARNSGAGNPELSNGTGSYALAQAAVPCLRSLVLSSVPKRLIFNSPTPLCTGLTALEISTADVLFSTSEMHKVLSNNLGLKSLVLRSGTSHTNASVPANDIQHTPVQILLPHLEVLAIATGPGFISWARGMIQLIHAPALNRLTLSCPHMSGYQGKKLVRYIATGMLTANANQNHSGLPNAPIYPTLSALNISQFPCAAEYLTRLLSALPSIMELCISDSQVQWVAKSPWLLPKLISLSVTGPIYSPLTRLLTRRAKEGTPIQVLRIQSLRQKFSPPLPDSVKIIVPMGQYPRSDHYGYLDDDIYQNWGHNAGASDEEQEESEVEEEEEEEEHRGGWDAIPYGSEDEDEDYDMDDYYDEPRGVRDIVDSDYYLSD